MKVHRFSKNFFSSYELWNNSNYFLLIVFFLSCSKSSFSSYRQYIYVKHHSYSFHSMKYPPNQPRMYVCFVLCLVLISFTSTMDFMPGDTQTSPLYQSSLSRLTVKKSGFKNTPAVVTFAIKLNWDISWVKN